MFCVYIFGSHTFDHISTITSLKDFYMPIRDRMYYGMALSVCLDLIGKMNCKLQDLATWYILYHRDERKMSFVFPESKVVHVVSVNSITL